MKKFVLLIGILLTAFAIDILLLTFNVFTHTEAAVSAAEPGKQLSKIKIDKSKDIVLNLENCEVMVNGWNRNYIEVRSTNLVKKEHQYSFSINANEISANARTKSGKRNEAVILSMPWMPLMQLENYWELFNMDTSLYEFSIYVPKDVPIRIAAEYICAEGCTVASVTGNTAVIRNSIVAKDFQEAVDALTVRYCTVYKSVKFKNQNSEIRDNKYIE